MFPFSNKDTIPITTNSGRRRNLIPKVGQPMTKHREPTLFVSGVQHVIFRYFSCKLSHIKEVENH